MADSKDGFEQLDVPKWKDEARDFTPWPENIEVLALGRSLADGR